METRCIKTIEGNGKNKNGTNELVTTGMVAEDTTTAAKESIVPKVTLVKPEEPEEEPKVSMNSEQKVPKVSTYPKPLDPKRAKRGFSKSWIFVACRIVFYLIPAST